MKLKVYVIDLEIPPKVKTWSLRIGVPAAVLLGGSAVAWAAGLHTWSNGDTLDATDLNGNFSNLQGQITSMGAPLFVFKKTGNNGTTSCDDFCSNHQAPYGTCVAAHSASLDGGTYIPCSAIGGGQNTGMAQDCWCAAPTP